MVFCFKRVIFTSQVTENSLMSIHRLKVLHTSCVSFVSCASDGILQGTNISKRKCDDFSVWVLTH